MKLDNVRSRLVAYIDQQERQGFGYGVNDCLLMTAGAVLAVLDDCPSRAKVEAVVTRCRGQYDSLAGGKKLLGTTPLRLVTSMFPAIPLSVAGDGDIAAKQVGKEWSFGVLVGPFFYVQTETGLAVLPRGDAQKAFRVE